MKITVTFDSLEEFQQHMTTGKARMKIAPEGVTVMPDAVITPAVMPDAVIKPAVMPDVLTTPAVVESVPVAAEAPEAPKPEKTEKPAEKPAEAPEEQKEEDTVTTEQVRKLLADLNKKAGKNLAKELIRQVGYKKLTDVPEGALPTLQSLVEEEAKNYA